MKKYSLFFLVLMVSLISCTSTSGQDLGDVRFIVLAFLLLIVVISAVASRN
ncbi:hypothetical protein [Psychroflexus sediminis]|uniref:hypothetical protein n=1 Tax=Psychroflexus sediminis TaxID=470826 RepID=UPI0015A44F35|nr:hypothetical protein [Psychroflexus sediminis]